MALASISLTSMSSSSCLSAALISLLSTGVATGLTILFLNSTTFCMASSSSSSQSNNPEIRGKIILSHITVKLALRRQDTVPYTILDAFRFFMVPGFNCICRVLTNFDEIWPHVWHLSLIPNLDWHSSISFP